MREVYRVLRSELSVQWFEDATALGQALARHPDQWSRRGLGTGEKLRWYRVVADL